MKKAASLSRSLQGPFSRMSSKHCKVEKIDQLKDMPPGSLKFSVNTDTEYFVLTVWKPCVKATPFRKIKREEIFLLHRF